jgi:hypothetical protein
MKWKRLSLVFKPIKPQDWMGLQLKQQEHFGRINYWQSQLAGVIKLLHKGGTQDSLTNWRPIAVLSLMYKIVAKLLANRIGTIIPRLIDIQQKGFVQGRNIHNILLSFKLAQEYVQPRKQQAFFFKLYFVKAYAKNFLWDTLAAMGFCSQFISLVQGLVDQ